MSSTQPEVKPVLALLLPMVAVGAAVILILGARYLLMDSGSGGAVASRAASLLGKPRIASVFKGDGPMISPGAALWASGDGDWFFGSGGNILSVRSRQWLLRATDPALSSFAVTPEGLVVTVRGASLGYVVDGAVQDRLALPARNLRLEPVGSALCLYGAIGERLSAVYRLEPGRYSKLFTFPGEITALTGAGEGLIFAAAGGLYRADFGGGLQPMLYLPARPAIRSVAWDPARQAVYFSTADSVYLLVENRLFRLVAGFGGTLRAAPEGLYILSEKTQELLRVDGIFKSA